MVTKKYSWKHKQTGRIVPMYLTGSSKEKIAREHKELLANYHVVEINEKDGQLEEVK